MTYGSLTLHGIGNETGNDGFTYYTFNCTHYHITLMVYSHWLSPGPEPGSRRMGCMVLIRTFHTATEQAQAPEQGQGRIGYALFFQGLKLFQVVCFNDISMVFRCPVLAPDTGSVNGFYIISVPVLVPVPIPETASVNTS